MIRVLIVDDQSLIRSGLRSALEAADGMEVVGEAADGAQAVSATREYRPDVVIMDLHLPNGGGVEATVQLVRMEESPRVLALTRLSTDDVVLQALNGGAGGFLEKDLIAGELAAAVRTLAAGGLVLSPENMKKLVSRAPARGSGFLREKIRTLTDSERAVLALIGAGHPNQSIAETLQLSLASVKTYVSRMLARLGLENRTQAAILAHEADLVGA
ncbi:response regulator transcription factor [Streptomyces sp. NBC_01280]|uniref:response regulator transcription factor n=1 Tax=unclassified Streptomyces TaxID=2593676 RepID=UPI002E33FC10|nr:response regulator transcription factor [Streptomyces sp. NBC_01280]WSE12303.1 response regulator transcription factor [Streptomyces sp. NBC_01397]WSE19326.1 response regulator transcription factor [Streptomyces sp. NBC_01397]